MKNKLTKQQFSELKMKIEAILTEDNCYTTLEYRAGWYDTFTAESLEKVRNGGVLVLLKSKVATGTIRKPFKPTVISYAVLPTTRAKIDSLLAEYDLKPANSFCSECCWQFPYA